jgi:hypothetical protein
LEFEVLGAFWLDFFLGQSQQTMIFWQSSGGSFGFPDGFPRRTTLAWALACIAVAAVLPLSLQETPHALPVHPDLDVNALQGFDGFVAKGPAGVQGKVGVSVAMADVNGDGLR